MMSETGSKGFTLIEVMVAVTVLAIGSIGVIGAYAGLINALEAADYSLETIGHLKEQMFEMERKAIESGSLTFMPAKGKIKGEYGNYKWRATSIVADSSLEEEVEGEEQEIEKAKKDLIMYVNKVTVRVSNEEVAPPRRLSLEGYVDTYAKPID